MKLVIIPTWLDRIREFEGLGYGELADVSQMKSILSSNDFIFYTLANYSYGVEQMADLFGGFGPLIRYLHQDADETIDMDKGEIDYSYMRRLHQASDYDRLCAEAVTTGQGVNSLQGYTLKPLAIGQDTLGLIVCEGIRCEPKEFSRQVMNEMAKLMNTESILRTKTFKAYTRN